MVRPETTPNDVHGMLAAKGILTSSSGSQLDLGGGGMKKQVTKQICDKVLEQGKSMR